MAFVKGEPVYFVNGKGERVYGEYDSQKKTRHRVKTESGKFAMPPFNGVFLDKTVKCECGSPECKHTGRYEKDDMKEGVTEDGPLWFHPVCVDFDQGDFNYCQDCEILVCCDLQQTLVFETTGIMDFCPKCWEHVSEEDKIEGRPE